MSFSIRKVAVLGAGVMGSGIAGHIANAGYPVLMLDIVPPKAAEGEDTSSKAFRNKFPLGALAKLPKAKPSPLYHPKALGLIEVGNFEDDMHRIAECDWVIEVVVENPEIKRKLFAQVENHWKPGMIVSSNTSGLAIESMVGDRSEAFRQHFLVTHFFNPVRYMKLLELVAGKDTLPEVMQTIHQFGEEILGKGIVYAKDTVNFIANRIGIYGIMKTMEEMQAAEMSVEEVDKIFGPAMGRPKSAVFRTADLVGLDTLVHVMKNCYDNLTTDEEREIFKTPAYLEKMLEQNLLGSKTGAGFYKRTKTAEGKKAILSLDLGTLEYKEQQKVRYDSLGKARKIDDVGQRIAAVLGSEDKAAKFAEKVTLATLAYTSRRIPEIADDIVNIDRGMRWGFGWDMGPFEAWDAFGVRKGLERMKALGMEPAPWVEEMLATGRESFYAVEGTRDTYWDVASKTAKQVPENRRTFRVDYLKRGERKVDGNRSATMWDMGDGIALVQFHTKMNSIDTEVIKLVHKAVDIAEKDFRGLVIGNDGQNFSVGANIMMILMGARAGQWDMIRDSLVMFQGSSQRLHYSKVPVVTCPAGLTLGGGCEMTMAGNAVQAAAETYIGLVEVGVGLIPGAGGNMMLLRNVYGPFAEDPGFDSLPFLTKVFMQIGMAKVATSAEEARDAGFFGIHDGISLNRDFQLNDAKMRCIGMAEAGFTPPRPTKFRLMGNSGRATIQMMLWDMEINKHVSAHDKLIGTKLGYVLTGGDCSPNIPVTEEYLLELEREAFLSLCGEEKTQARLAHMLETGKPLRN
ncbi:MAG: enoyl-CoA hydratase/isomerase family protein [Bradymonadales bacterium]|nr:enoyl-CoA hydratase/isomerase family protein [Bradymonadales bacterium]